MCIQTDELLWPHSGLNLTIYFEEDAKPITVHGRAVWQRRENEKHLVGIQFDQITEKISDTIFKYAFEYKREELMQHWFKGLNR